MGQSFLRLRLTCVDGGKAPGQQPSWSSSMRTTSTESGAFGLPPEKTCEFHFVPHLRPAERLVALGFRHWLEGCATGDLSEWETAWVLYEQCLGRKDATVAIDALAGWVGAVSICARRDVHTFPSDCRSFSHDECVAVALVAASQYKAGDVAPACARQLTGRTRVEAVVTASEHFGLILLSLGQKLQPSAIELRSAD